MKINLLNNIGSITISEGNSKMGLLPSFSTTPGVCGSCPINCNGCYAMNMERRFPSVKKSYANNFAMVQQHLYLTFEAINRYLQAFRPALFRWHVSGDIQNFAYFDSMVKTAEKNPQTQFFAFTKRYSVVNDWLVSCGALPTNLNIIFSGWPGLPMKNPHGLPVAWMQDGTEDRVPETAEDCPGNCTECQKCAWIGKGESVVFNKH